MKKIYLILLLQIFIFIQPSKADPQFWSKQVSHNNVLLDTTSTVLAQVATSFPSNGKVLVQFDGFCRSSVGDMIVLAASDYPDWNTNDGNLGSFAWDTISNTKSFSHSRVYNVTAGPDTFYAIGQNYVCNNGNGFADVYGLVTVTFFPDTGADIVEQIGFDSTYTLDAGPVVINSVTINPTVAGHAIVRINGGCAADVGDRIYLGVTDAPAWSGTVEPTYLETVSGAICEDVPFTNARVFSINAGSHTFYAMGENYTETDGNGSAYIAASLTVEFYPTGGPVNVGFADIAIAGVNLSTGPIDLGSATISNVPGDVLVRFEGVCESDSGDYIMLAASPSVSWSLNTGSVTVAAPDTDVTSNSFSHSKAYVVLSPTIHDYHAVAENTILNAGSGNATIHGTLTVLNFPTLNTNVSELSGNIRSNVFPNPFSNSTTISVDIPDNDFYLISAVDVTGRVIKTFAEGNLAKGLQKFTWNSSGENPGVYFLRIENSSSVSTVKIILVK